MKVSAHHRITELLVDYRLVLVTIVVLLTVALAVFVPRLRVDPTLASFFISGSPEYRLYEKLRRVFGNDEFILVAIKSADTETTPVMLERLAQITEELGNLEKIANAKSLCNTRVLAERNGRFGAYPIVRKDDGTPVLPGPDELAGFSRLLPAMDLLISQDRKTLGIIVRLRDECRFDPDVGVLLDRVRNVVKTRLPEGAEYRIIGPPVMREAFLNYNLRSALMFGGLGLIVATIVTLSIFRSLRVTIMTLVVVNVALVWLLGIMALLGILINTATSLSFGIILIISTATIIHVVTHYDKHCQHAQTRLEALKRALDTVLWPSVMCSVTTSVGFASTMVSAIPMVRQVGLILSLGVLLSGSLTLVMTTALLPHMKPVGAAMYSRMSSDWVVRILNRMKQLTFSHPGACALVGIVMVVALLLGIPRIHVRTAPMALFSDSTPEVTDIRFVQENLSPIQSLEVLVEMESNAFKRPQAWKQLADLEARLAEIPEVLRVDSLIPLLEHTYACFSGPDANTDEMYSRDGVIPELLLTLSFSSEGKRLIRRYLGPEFGLARLTLRLTKDRAISISHTIAKIEQIVAGTELGRAGMVKVTGVLAVYSSQVSHLAAAQTLSLVLALCLITCLMALQFRSLVMGLLSLIPNFLPMAVIFGIMGWFGIALDSMTIFAATVSIGLSVDDTIHYITQLRRQMGSETDFPGVTECLSRTHDITARALISTSAVLAFGFLSLLLSPFRPVAWLGVLLSCGVVAALIGDLVFMPSVILSFKPVRRMLRKSRPDNVAA